jgi:hypothetical protein
VTRAGKSENDFDGIANHLSVPIETTVDFTPFACRLHLKTQA